MLSVLSFSCDPVFEPLQEGEFYFSLYGYLDLNADDHWFRVASIRETVVNFSDSIDAVVSLRRESTGEISELEGYRFSRFLGDEGRVYYWNFVSFDSIKAGEAYTLQATNSSGESSYATVRIPNDFPVPVSQNFDESSFTGLVTGTGVEDLVVIERTYHLSSSNNSWRVTVSGVDTNKVSIEENGDFRISFNDRSAIIENVSVPLSQLTVTDAYMRIVSGNESWPESTNSVEEAALTDAQKNVTNGMGVVAGVATRSISLQPCYDASDNVIACPPRKVKNPDIFTHSGMVSVQE